MKLDYCESRFMRADILTKTFAATRLNELHKLLSLGGRYFPSLLLEWAQTAAHTAGDRTNDLRQGVRALK
ncbi:unnamed protein product [Albugo candida]|uniref:Uncharacterized protein n=1 Tax=Albugo candida TaxID=65357 RepID=A0A024FXN8_9STRA|nr:unnamed protein product [Albugo candida]|eukprot:CCI11419.1 unnamed protein product [Albugo candida]